jgi:hypothetical protein
MSVDRIDRAAHLRCDLFARALNRLGYSLDAIDRAVERSAWLQAAGGDWGEANAAALREIDALPPEQRFHRYGVANEARQPGSAA